MIGLGVFGMAWRHVLVSLRHAAPSPGCPFIFFQFLFFIYFYFYLLFLWLLLLFEKRWQARHLLWRRVASIPALLDVSVQGPGLGQLLQTVSSFIVPGLLIRHPLFYDFTVADPWLFAQLLKHSTTLLINKICSFWLLACCKILLCDYDPFIVIVGLL